jgi:hypothetical protein
MRSILLEYLEFLSYFLSLFSFDSLFLMRHVAPQFETSLPNLEFYRAPEKMRTTICR